MALTQLESYREQIITIGKEAYRKGLVVAWGGNISVRLNPSEFLMTAHQAALGFLSPSNFLVMDLKGTIVSGEGKPSTETKLHSAIYHNTEAEAVVHLHPPYTNVLAVKGVKITPMTFESSLFLGTTPVIAQESPSVTHPEKVIEALKLSNIIILREHGTVAVGGSLLEAFFLTEILEEAAMMAYLGESLGAPAAKEERAASSKREGLIQYPVFSKEHIEKVIELVNSDEEVQRLGVSTHLTVRYAIKLLDTDQVYNFHFQEGKIIKVSNDEDADFVIAGKREQWVAVLNGQIDPFAATTQKKLKLQKGNVGDLSKWYPPFYRVFKLWEYAPVE